MQKDIPETHIGSTCLRAERLIRQDMQWRDWTPTSVIAKMPVIFNKTPDTEADDDEETRIIEEVWIEIAWFNDTPTYPDTNNPDHVHPSPDTSCNYHQHSSCHHAS